MSYNTSTSVRLSPLPGDNTIYVYDREQQKIFTADGVELTDSEKEAELKILNSVQTPSGNVQSSPQAIESVPFGNTSDNNSPSSVVSGNGFGQPSGVSFGALKYPIGVPENGQDKNDYIEFRPMELNLGSGVVRGFGIGNSSDAPLSGAYGPNANRRQFREVSGGGNVQLGIQAPIQDTNMVDWGEGGVNMLEAILYNAAMSSMNSNIDSIASGFEEAIKSLTAEGNAAIENVLGGSGNAEMHKSLFAAMAAGNPGIFTRAQGMAFNPNIELLFNKPQLRPFNFSFLLSASSKKEAQTIKKIIKFFKYHMAVKVNTGTGLFLRTPNVFSIDYKLGNGNTQDSIGRIAPFENQSKACALLNFNTDYTPLGSYMTYKDDSGVEHPMVAYRLSMQFQEIVPIYDVDYENLPDNAIGY